MRRNDREIKSREEMLEILSKCDVIRLGINTLDYPYVVPMNFGVEDGRYNFGTGKAVEQRAYFK